VTAADQSGLRKIDQPISSAQRIQPTLFNESFDAGVYIAFPDLLISWEGGCSLHSPQLDTSWLRVFNTPTHNMYDHWNQFAM